MKGKGKGTVSFNEMKGKAGTLTYDEGGRSVTATVFKDEGESMEGSC